jgi:hypothetical protein
LKLFQCTGLNDKRLRPSSKVGGFVDDTNVETRSAKFNSSGHTGWPGTDDQNLNVRHGGTPYMQTTVCNHMIA